MTATNLDPVDTSIGESFAWCFSHGRLHRFGTVPWCTAEWVRLPGRTETEALTAKHDRYGDDQFIHHLPLDVQTEIVAGRTEGDNQ